MYKPPLKVGIVGCGGVSKGVYVDLYAGLGEIAQVVAVADMRDEMAEERRQHLVDAYLAEAASNRVLAARASGTDQREVYIKKADAADVAAKNNIRKYNNHEELLKDEEVQVMVLLTNPTIRAVPVVAAAQAGKHVFSEGPMAPSVEEADAIVDAVKKSGIKYHNQCMPMYTRGVALAQKAVASGKMGKMGFAKIEMNRYRPPSYYKGWQGKWELEGGNAAYHHGRYWIDPFLWIVGSPIVEVFAHAGPQLRDIETDSVAMTLVRFANGAYGYIFSSLISHPIPGRPIHGGRIEVQGMDAGLFATSGPYGGGPEVTTTFDSGDNPAAVEALEELRKEVVHIPESQELAGNGQRDQTRMFFDTILNDTEPMVPIDIYWRHAELSRAIYKSAEERDIVKLPLDKNDPFYSPRVPKLR